MNAVIEAEVPSTQSFQVYKSTPEDELNAMSAINKALKVLDSSARERVLNWAASLYMPETVPPSHSFRNEHQETKQDNSKYKDLHDFLEHVETSTKLESAMAIAYWFQAIQGQDSFSSQQINDQLKEMGNPIKNITDAFDSLVNQNLVRQIEKSGKSKQARKKFRLTKMGTEKIEELMKK